MIKNAPKNIRSIGVAENTLAHYVLNYCSTNAFAMKRERGEQSPHTNDPQRA